MQQSKPYYQYLYGITEDKDGNVVNNDGRKVQLETILDCNMNIVPPVIFGLDKTPYDDIRPARYNEDKDNNKPVWVKQGAKVLQKVPMVVYVDVSDIGIELSSISNQGNTNPMGQYVRDMTKGIAGRDRWTRLVDRLVNTPMRELVDYMYTEDWQLRKHVLDLYEVNEEDLSHEKSDVPRQARIVPFIEKGNLLSKYGSTEVSITEEVCDDEDDEYDNDDE